MTLECERCNETENVVRFRHFDTMTDEFLCWNHRWPIVEQRLHPERLGKKADLPEPKREQRSLIDFVVE